MNILADNWTATGSIATSFGAIAAFLTIAATVLVYRSQSRASRAAAIRQNLQFIHSLESQVTRSIESGFLATIDRQIREFRDRLGQDAQPSYFLEQLFGNGQDSDDRSLFKASALDSNLSSTMYIRMSDIWDRMNMKAFEFRGALCVFSIASQVLTEEARSLCAPENTTRILDCMKDNKAKEALSEINDLDDLVNRLLSHQIKWAGHEWESDKNKIVQGCYFINKLADKTLLLPDRKLLKLAHKKLAQKEPALKELASKLASNKMSQPSFGEIAGNPSEAIEKSLCNLRPQLKKEDLACLRKIVDGWDPKPVGT
jgi:hypothetical protein